MPFTITIDPAKIATDIKSYLCSAVALGDPQGAFLSGLPEISGDPVSQEVPGSWKRTKVFIQYAFPLSILLAGGFFWTWTAVLWWRWVWN